MAAVPYGIVDTAGWQREIRRRVNGLGVALRFDSAAEMASTDGRTITVPVPPDNATWGDYQIVRGQVIHETGHILRPAAFELVREEGINMLHPLGVLVNQIEDRAQERAAAEPFIGDRIALDYLHCVINERVLARFSKDPSQLPAEGTPEHDVTAKLNAALWVGYRSAADWLPKTAKMIQTNVPVMARLLGPLFTDTYEALIQEGWIERIREVTDPVHSIREAKALFARLFPEMPPPPEMSPEEAAAVATAMGKVPWELVLQSDHGQRPNEAGPACPSSIDWATKTRNQLWPEWYPNPQVAVPTPAAERALGIRYPVDLVQETRRLLQARARSKIYPEQLDGRLDKRNITRLVMPQVGDGTYNRSVFTKKKAGLTLDVAVTVLVDSSGSMSGKKFEAATQAAVCLYDLCAAALRVPCEVLGFTHHYPDVPQFHLYKEFRERSLPREAIVARMDRARDRLAGNSDGDAVIFAAGRIREQRASRKVVIVLSDGCPAEAMNGDPDATLRAAIAEIRRAGDVELYGIGIQDANVRRYYSPEAPVIEEIHEVAPALLHVLRDVLQKEVRA